MRWPTASRGCYATDLPDAWRQRATRDIGQVGRVLGPDGKWGRHRCRPHSHRCVAVMLRHECRSAADLASDVSPVARPKTYDGFMHRRSHRHPAPPSGWPGRVAARREPFADLSRPTFDGRLRSRAFRNGRSLERTHRLAGQKTMERRLLRHPTGRPGPWKNSVALPSSTRLPWTEVRRVAGLEHRMDSNFHVFSMWKYRTLSGCYAVKIGAFPPRSDDFKLRQSAESGKRHAGELSTKCPNCLWSRVENSTTRRKRNRVSDPAAPAAAAAAR